MLNNSFHVSSEEEDINIYPITRKRRRIMVIDREESDAEDHAVTDTSGNTPPFTRTWTLPTGNQRRIIPFKFSYGSTIMARLYGTRGAKMPRAGRPTVFSIEIEMKIASYITSLSNVDIL